MVASIHIHLYTLHINLIYILHHIHDSSAPLNQPKTTQAPAPPLSTKPSMSSIAASAKDNNTKPAKQTTTDKKTASAAAPVRSLVAESPRKTEKPSARDKSNIKSEGGGAKRAKIDNNNNTATTVREGKATSKPQVPLAAKPHAAAADKKPVDTANKKAAEATTKGPSPPKVPVLAFELGQQEATKKLGNIALGSVSSYSDFKTVVSKQFADAFSESGGKRSVVFKDEEGDWIFMNGAIPWSVVQAAAKQVMIVPKNLTKKK